MNFAELSAQRYSLRKFSDRPVEDALLRQERSRLLARAVKSLTDGEQTLFDRKYYYCQSTAQIAAELGLTERGVEGRLYRLRQTLRQQLGGDLYD